MDGYIVIIYILVKNNIF